MIGFTNDTALTAAFFSRIRSYHINTHMSKKYYQGIFTPKNPQKYIGDVSKIVYRSGWERKYMDYCDENPAILQWNSEDAIIPYLSPLDNKWHKYHIDFYIKYKERSGNIGQSFIEIKPYKETLEPKKGKKRQKTYMNEVITYLRNQAKWKYARQFAKKKGCKFIVITEKTMPQLLRG